MRRGGDRGGVPLGYFKKYGVSGGISSLEKKIECVFFGGRWSLPMVHAVTLITPNTYTYVVAPFLDF